MKVIGRVMGSCRAVISLSEIVEGILEEATDNGFEDDDENLEEPTDETDSEEDPDAWVPCHEIDLYDNEEKEN